MSDETRILAEYASRVTIHDIPTPVVDRTERLILDFIGNAIRGGAEADSSPSIRAMVDRAGLGGVGQCSVLSDTRHYGPAAAALLNGAFGHSLDFDDTHAASSLHPSAPVVSAALAAAQISRSSGPELVTAITIGYEVCCRLGLALDPTRHYARGFHPTATAGTFGAAAAAGSLQFLANGAWNKRYQVGAAAMNGLLAALLAAEDFLGASSAVEGEHGFLKAYSDGADPSVAVSELGQRYETMRIGLKPYPSCRYTHAALDGLMALRTEHGLVAADVDRLVVGLHRNGITLTGEPLEAKRRVRSIVAGQFSMPFTAALALDQGSFDWDDYRRIGDPKLDALCDRVDVVSDPSLEGHPHPFGATLRLVTTKGVFEARIPDPSGEPASFPDDLALERKFMTLAAPVLGEKRARDLCGSILSLSTMAASDLDAMLRP